MLGELPRQVLNEYGELGPIDILDRNIQMDVFANTTTITTTVSGDMNASSGLLVRG